METNQTTESGHTPGDWIIDDPIPETGSIHVYDNCNGVACVVAIVPENFTDTTKAHRNANARLIAGAPALLEQLVKSSALLLKAEAALFSLTKTPKELISAPQLKEIEKLRHQAKDQALDVNQMAIAKAEGRS